MYNNVYCFELFTKTTSSYNNTCSAVGCSQGCPGCLHWAQTAPGTEKPPRGRGNHPRPTQQVSSRTHAQIVCHYYVSTENINLLDMDSDFKMLESLKMINQVYFMVMSEQSVQYCTPCLKIILVFSAVSKCHFSSSHIFQQSSGWSWDVLLSFSCHEYCLHNI